MPPSTYSSASKGSSSAEEPKVGAPLPPIGSPSLSRIATVGSKMPPSAFATPSVSRTVASTPSSKEGSWPSSVSTASLEVTTASMPRLPSSKILPNDWSIVSVST